MNMYARINELLAGNEQFVIVNVVDAMGSSPGRQGFRMIVREGGLTEGTIGGGAVEHEARERALACLRDGKSLFEEINLEAIGMSCGGSMKLYYEYIDRGRHLYLFGGGHVCQALVPMAVSLGYKVIVMDNRPEVAKREIHPLAVEVHCGDLKELIEKTEFKTPAGVLIFTHKHLHDQDVLKAILKKDVNFSYIGMIGSKKKVHVTFDMLVKEGISEEKVRAVYSPVGINIGADTPAEISISILAEMIALEKGREVPHMRMKR
jgi:xanthine dehydrogenase accessory factor